MSELTVNKVLHVLRNPWGWSEDEIREVRLAAADLIEQAARRAEPVAEVVTVGGYPDESEHTVKWLVSFKYVKHGDKLYAAPQQEKN